jgi:hypothetical protein
LDGGVLLDASLFHCVAGLRLEALARALVANATEASTRRSAK